MGQGGVQCHFGPGMGGFQMGGGGFGDLFEQMHGQRRQQQQARKPPEREQQLQVTLEDLYRGAKVSTVVVKTRYVASPMGLMQQESRSQVEIDVKRGWRAGQKATVKGGESESDVSLIVTPRRHARFQSEGDDLIYECMMPLSCLFGFHYPRIKFRNIAGRLVEADIAEDCRATSFREKLYPGVETVLRGQGMPAGSSGEFGDCIVRVAMCPPRTVYLLGGYLRTGLRYALGMLIFYSFITGGNVLGLLWLLFVARSFFGGSGIL